MDRSIFDITTKSNGKIVVVSAKKLHELSKQFDKFVYLKKTDIVSDSIKITSIPEDVGFKEYKGVYLMVGYTIYGAYHKSNEIRWLATVYKANSQPDTP